MPTFPEPTWGTPEDMDLESAFAKKDYRGFELAAATVKLIQYQFSDPNNIENPQLKKLIWTTNTVQTKIFIGLAYERNDKESSISPGIYVERSESVADNAGGIRFLMVQAGSETMNDPNYLKNMQGTITVVCEGLTGGEAEAIADEVFQRMMVFSPVIRDDFHLDNFDVKGVGKTEKREKGTGFICPVILTWQKLTRWALQADTSV